MRTTMVPLSLISKPEFTGRSQFILKNFILLITGIVFTLEASAHIRHVPSEYPTIQAGINAANPGDTVLVAEGIYHEKINLTGRQPILVGSNFIMDGKISHVTSTIIDGSQLTGTDRSLAYFGSGNDSTTILSGFTLQHGHGTVRDDPFRQVLGGAIFIAGGGGMITHNIIRDNIVKDSILADPRGDLGGAIFIDYDAIDYWTVITNNIIRDNTIEASTFRAMGGGICALNNVRIANNMVSNNSCVSINPLATDISGGGIMFLGLTPKLAFITGNVVDSNYISGTSGNPISGGGISCSGNSNVLELIASDNLVRFNHAYLPGADANIYGGGMAITAALQEDSRIENNRFEGNECKLMGMNPGASWGGGIYASGTDNADTSLIKIAGNRFIGNSADLGGGISLSGLTLHLYNNIFSMNKALFGGGGYVDIADVFGNQNHTFIINNTFYENSTFPDGQAGALQFEGANPVVMNNIFCHDSASANIFGNEIYFHMGTLELVNCDFDTVPSGVSIDFDNGNIIKTNIIFQDPIFSNTTDLHPNVWSPCVDAGATQYASQSGSLCYPPLTDILGTARPAGAGYDIGAYEDIAGGVGINTIADYGLRITNYPNPFTGSTTFSFDLVKSGKIRLKVYDGFGKLVAVPVNEDLSEGNHEIRWDSSVLPAGIYFYKAILNNNSVSGKLVKVK